MNTITEQDVKALLSKHPELHVDGWGLSHQDRRNKVALDSLSRRPLWDADGIEMINAVAGWLKRIPKSATKKPNSGHHNSYWVKHIAEEFIGYNTNGHFIAAALLSGFEIVDVGYNPTFNMHKPTVERAYQAGKVERKINELTLADIVELFKHHDTLNICGYAQEGDRDLEVCRQLLLHDDSLEAIKETMRWIAWNMKQVSAINRKHTSYGLKHLAEKQIGYIFNGEFVAAALLLGYGTNCKPWTGKSKVSPSFNMSEAAISEAYRNSETMPFGPSRAGKTLKQLQKEIDETGDLLHMARFREALGE